MSVDEEHEFEIEMLTTLEAIRRRPGMFVGADGVCGVAEHLVCGALCHGLAELACGAATGVEIAVDGLRVRVADDGTGWPVHVGTDGRRFAERVLTDLYACRDFKQHEELAHELCRVSLPVVVALSKRFVFQTCREGAVWRQVYVEGVAEGPLAEVNEESKAGTVMEFVLDEGFCGAARISVPAIEAWVKALGAKVPVGSVRVRGS
ncbi:hypothetical protein [Prosthecobacter sp.]|uniref:hypothetical protein n=1 Tax=Prosthecobacter sp. TaxID=1965333 RepID=UPI003784896F